jgi:hypothetical protein
MEDGWVPLSWGASIHGGVKCYVPECLVRHRRHERNDTVFRKKRTKVAEARENKRLAAAGKRYLAMFPRSRLLLDFAGAFFEFLRSPVPNLYEGLLRRRLWIFGVALARIAGRAKHPPDLSSHR